MASKTKKKKARQIQERAAKKKAMKLQAKKIDQKIADKKATLKLVGHNEGGLELSVQQQEAKQQIESLAHDFQLCLDDVEVTLMEIEDGDIEDVDNALLEIGESITIMRKLRKEVNCLVSTCGLKDMVIILVTIKSLEGKVATVAQKWEAHKAEQARKEHQLELERLHNEERQRQIRRTNLESIITMLNIKGIVTEEKVSFGLRKRFFALVPTTTCKKRSLANCEKAEQLLDLVESIFPNLAKVKELRPLIKKAYVKDPRAEYGLGLRTVRAA